MSNYSSYIPTRAMAIVAHPDDIEFGCAGTLARWVQEGCKVAYLLVTSGDVGIAEPNITRAQAAAIREAETLVAAQIIGVRDVVFLREPDGMVENTLALRKRLVREIRIFKPEVVITDDPTLMFTAQGRINHPDHRAVGTATVDAIFPCAGQPHFYEELATEGIFAHKVRKVYIMARGQGETFINISDTIDLKLQALQAHVSQVGEMKELEKMLRERTAQYGAGKEMAHAEVFRVFTLESDENWTKLQAQATAT
jgi:LmbE family N-acetylglucosaminyl deacetylase